VAETAVRKEAWAILLKYAMDGLISLVVFHGTVRMREKLVTPKFHCSFNSRKRHYTNIKINVIFRRY
jgi:hypothetical protein